MADLTTRKEFAGILTLNSGKEKAMSKMAITTTSIWVGTELSNWHDQLVAAETKSAPWPLPVGHRIFSHPGEYKVVDIR